MTFATTDSPPSGPVPYFRALIQLQKSGLGPVAWLGSAWVEALGDYGTEWLQFVSDRIAEDIRTQHALLHCTSTSDIHAIQAAFLQRAADTYAARTGRLSGIGQGFLDALKADRQV